MSLNPDTADRFDDGLVHNHHWAVTSDEAYPSYSHGPVFGRSHVEVSPMQSHRQWTPGNDHHDDGLVHNHDWAVTGK